MIMSCLKILAHSLMLLSIIVTSSYITICISNTELYEGIARNLSSNLGDFLWGTVGVILTFVSTLFLFLTFNSQQKQYKETKDDAFRARFEGTFFNMLSMYYNVRSETDKRISIVSEGKYNSLNEFYIGFKDFYNEQVLKTKDFANAMQSFEKDMIMESEYQTAVSDLGYIYDRYVDNQNGKVGFYFRYIHNLISFVLKHWKNSNEDVHTYLNFIQAQMSDEELALVFYDCISQGGLDKGRKFTFKQNLDKYSFLENISEFTLINRSHYKVFPKTIFGFLNDDERKMVRDRQKN